MLWRYSLDLLDKVDISISIAFAMQHAQHMISNKLSYYAEIAL